jgi:hypothetical protein
VLIYDTIQLIANTIINNDLVTTLATTSSSVSCEKETIWGFGQAFINFMKTSNTTGLSGGITFSMKTGERNNISLNIVDMTKNGVDLVSLQIKVSI